MSPAPREAAAGSVATPVGVRKPCLPPTPTPAACFGVSVCPSEFQFHIGNVGLLLALVYISELILNIK